MTRENQVKGSDFNTPLKPENVHGGSLPDADEAQLMDQLNKGDRSAFTEVYYQLYQRLYFFALRFVGEAEAEDITAESFIELWKRIATPIDTEADTAAKSLAGQIKMGSLNEVSAFLYVIVRNRCLNAIRNRKLRDQKQGHLTQLLETQSADDHLLEQVRIELVNLIYAHVQQLPQRMQQVFLLSFQQGLKPAQIADQLGISVQTVSNQKLSAIKLLKQLLQEKGLLSILLLLMQLDQP